jgi:hypothetical protein
MSIRQILFLILLSQYTALATAAKVQTDNCDIPYFAGPFQLTQRTNQTSSSHFYIYNKTGQPFAIKFECLEMYTNEYFRRMMVRVFDPDENLISRDFVTSPQFIQDQNLPSQLTINVPASDTNAIIQVIATGGRTAPAIFDFTTEPAMPFGLMSSIKVITPPKNPIEKGFIYIPTGAAQLFIQPVDTEITIWDENDNVILKNKTAAIPVHKTDVIWKISLKPKKFPGAKVFTNGFDVIICPDLATAKAISGSIEKLDDGSIVAHKFQVRLDRLLRKTFASPDNFTLYPIKSFEPLKKIFYSNPEKYQHLITDYRAVLPYLNIWFDRQIIDSNAPLFGGIHAPASYSEILTPYQISSSKLRISENKSTISPPAVTNQPQHNLLASFSTPGIADSLAFLYNLDPNINPYYHNINLLNRIIIASCRDLMLLDESELIYGRDGTDWLGTFAFAFRYKYCDAYGAVGQVVKQLYPEIYKEWTNGLTRFADHVALMPIFAPANQSAHIPYGLWRVYEGSKEQFYKDLTAITVEKLCQNLQKPAGYYVEGYGPCASYAGITLDLFAMLYIDSQMPILKDSIEKAYYCFNHTVVSEPDGTLIGATDFNHRVQVPWTASQHGSGRTMMAQYLPEVAIWSGYKRKDSNELKEKIEKKLKEIPYPVEHFSNKTDFDFKTVSGASRRLFQYYSPKIAPGGSFPYEENIPFIRNIGDEFVAVKQPGYYALIYVGKPGIPPANRAMAPMQKGPRTGGGLSLLWLPDYKVLLAGQGWNSFSHHGIIVETKPEKVHYADYYAVKFALDIPRKQLVVEGKINDTPLTYTHQYTFEPNSIKVQTIIEAEKSFESQSCYLQFPVFAAKQRVFIPNVPPYNTSVIRFSDSTKAAAYLLFKEPVKAELSKTFTEKINGTDYEIQQLKIYLPTEWKKSQTAVLSYEISKELNL